MAHEKRETLMSHVYNYSNYSVMDVTEDH